MTGTTLTFKAATVSGLRGIKVTDLTVTAKIASGPTLSASVPEAMIYMDIIELLYGRVVVDRVRMDAARLRVTRSTDAAWIPAASFKVDGALPFFEPRSFRILGDKCRLDVENIAGGSTVSFTDFSMDVSRLPEARELDARLDGLLNGQAEQRVNLRLSYAAPDDFALRAQCSELTADVFNAFAPAQWRLITTGVTRPKLRVDAYPGAKQLVISLSAPIESMTLREQPSFLETTTSGTLTILANYDVSAALLTFLTAKADSEFLRGALDGSVSFASEEPEIDLNVEASRFPAAKLLELLLQRTDESYGAVDGSLLEPCSLSVALHGALKKPSFTGEFRAAGGKFVLAPNDARYPKAELELGQATVAWDSETGKPKGEIRVLNGAISYPKLSLSAEKLAGSVALVDGKATANPLTAEVTGKPVVAHLEFDIEKKQLQFDISGALDEIEKTPMATAIRDTVLSGSGIVAAKGVVKQGTANIQGAIDATQMRIEHDWWFDKPQGVGARGKVAVRYTANKAVIITVENAEVASSELTAELRMSRAKTKWQLDRLEAESDELDVTTVGKCLRIPYTITGDKATSARYEWSRIEDAEPHTTSSLSCAVNEISAVALGSELRLTCSNLSIDTTMNRKGETRTGDLIAGAVSATAPPLGSGWYIPLEPSPDLAERFPKISRDWTYTLSAKALQMEPWAGKDFAAKAFTTKAVSGFTSYSARVDGGTIEGAYRNNNVENTYETNARWMEIPASAIIQHMKLPEILTGAMSGEIAYAGDKDDPNNRSGKGSFTINEGQFSADYVIPFIEGKVSQEISVLPTSLRFSKLSSDVVLDRDQCRTPNLHLESKGITLDASGNFIRDGDMDYELNVSLTPEVAQQIDMLKPYINIEGHRLAQQNIDLAFKITGPTFNPKSQLSKAPGTTVTLISGALEVTSEAIHVIDLPRRVLLDLLRVGGGIVRPTS